MSCCTMKWLVVRPPYISAVCLTFSFALISDGPPIAKYHVPKRSLEPCDPLSYPNRDLIPTRNFSLIYPLIVFNVYVPPIRHCLYLQNSNIFSRFSVLLHLYYFFDLSPPKTVAPISHISR